MTADEPSGITDVMTAEQLQVIHDSDMSGPPLCRGPSRVCPPSVSRLVDGATRTNQKQRSWFCLVPLSSQQHRFCSHVHLQVIKVSHHQTCWARPSDDSDCLTRIQYNWTEPTLDPLAIIWRWLILWTGCSDKRYLGLDFLYLLSLIVTVFNIQTTSSWSSS